MIESAFRSPWLDQEVLWCGILTILLIISWAAGFGLVFGIFYAAFVYFNLNAFGKRRFAELYDAGEKYFDRHCERIDIRLISKIFFLTAVPFIIFANIMDIAPTTAYADMIAQNNKAFVEDMIETLPFNEPALENFQSKASESTATLYLSMLYYALVMGVLLMLASAFGSAKTIWQSFGFREAKYYDFRNKNFRAISIVLPVGVLILYFQFGQMVVSQILFDQFLKVGNHTADLYIRNLYRGVFLLIGSSFLAVSCVVTPASAIIHSYLTRKKLKD